MGGRVIVEGDGMLPGRGILRELTRWRGESCCEYLFAPIQIVTTKRPGPDGTRWAIHLPLFRHGDDITRLYVTGPGDDDLLARFQTLENFDAIALSVSL